VATQEEVQEAMRQVIDPELGINIVDLGLIYDIEVQDGDVHVAMTMTTPGCPLVRYIQNAAEAAIWQTVPEICSVELDLVWTPPWQPAMMSDVAKAELGWT
jgi:metal-sulfur cluster biosynthetic enzyme